MEQQLTRPRRRWDAPAVQTAPAEGAAVLLACTRGLFDCKSFGDPPNTCVDQPCQCPSFPGRRC